MIILHIFLIIMYILSYCFDYYNYFDRRVQLFAAALPMLFHSKNPPDKLQQFDCFTSTDRQRHPPWPHPGRCGRSTGCAPPAPRHHPGFLKALGRLLGGGCAFCLQIFLFFLFSFFAHYFCFVYFLNFRGKRMILSYFLIILIFFKKAQNGHK